MIEADSPNEAARLSSCVHGMLNFVGGLVLGHAFKPAARMSSDIFSCGRVTHGSKLVAPACDVVCQVASSAKPKTLSSYDPSGPIILYTCNFFEDGIGVWGAFLIGCEDAISHVVQSRVPSELVNKWVKQVGQQIICEIELFAYCSPRVYFAEILESRRGIVFVENEAFVEFH